MLTYGGSSGSSPSMASNSRLSYVPRASLKLKLPRGEGDGGEGCTSTRSYTFGSPKRWNTASSHAGPDGALHRPTSAPRHRHASTTRRSGRVEDAGIARRRARGGVVDGVSWKRKHKRKKVTIRHNPVRFHSRGRRDGRPRAERCGCGGRPRVRDRVASLRERRRVAFSSHRARFRCRTPRPGWPRGFGRRHRRSASSLRGRRSRRASGCVRSRDRLVRVARRPPRGVHPVPPAGRRERRGRVRPRAGTRATRVRDAILKRTRRRVCRGNRRRRRFFFVRRDARPRRRRFARGPVRFADRQTDDRRALCHGRAFVRHDERKFEPLRRRFSRHRARVRVARARRGVDARVLVALARRRFESQKNGAASAGFPDPLRGRGGPARLAVGPGGWREARRGISLGLFGLRGGAMRSSTTENETRPDAKLRRKAPAVPQPPLRQVEPVLAVLARDDSARFFDGGGGSPFFGARGRRSITSVREESIAP